MLIFVLVVLGITTRLLPHASQFTAVLAVAMLAGVYLKPRLALFLPLGVMMLTDLILGFHDTMFFTWGSMVLISLVGIYLRNHRHAFAIFGGSLVSALIFFVVSNFGAWLSLYPHTFAGLQECYWLAIPFFRTTVLSTVVFSVGIFFVYEFILEKSKGKALARLL